MLGVRRNVGRRRILTSKRSEFRSCVNTYIISINFVGLRSANLASSPRGGGGGVIVYLK